MHEGKIVKALSGFYYVLTDQNEIIECRGRGVFRKHKITPLVGDYVVFRESGAKRLYSGSEGTKE